MNKVKFTEFPEAVQANYNSNWKMRQALDNLRAGRKHTPRSHFFYEHKDEDWCLSQLTKAIESMQDLPLLAEWDKNFFPKIGAQGGVAPFKERLPRFEEYWNHLEVPQILQDAKLKRMIDKAIKEVIKDFGFNESGTPIDVADVIRNAQRDSKLNTSAAYNTYGKKDDPAVQAAAIADEPTAIEQEFPNTPGSRATPGKTEEQARFIFMTAYAVVLRGQKYQQALQKYLMDRKIEYFAPWRSWTEVQNVASKFEDKTWKLSADYDKMDQHFNVHHAKIVFEVIKHYFKRAYWDDVWKSIEYVFTQPCVTPEGYVDEDHALFSGESWTNLLETVYNYIMWKFIKLTYHIHVKHAVGVGDDQLVELLNSEKWTPQQADKVLDLIIHVYQMFGTPGNKEKNLFSQDTFEFCQRKACKTWNGRDGKTKWALAYRLSRWFEMNRWPERFHNERMEQNGKKVNIYNKFTFVYQGIMRTENLINSPKFDWAVKFLMNSNPAVKEFIALKNSEILQQEKRARKISSLYETYNQEKANKGIFEFETFKELRKLLRTSRA